jgi:hypothetical protein
MNKHLYKNVSVNDFDKHNCIKLSWWFYLSTAYLLKAYFVWILSIANRSDSLSFISMVYPDPKLFYINLFSGLTGVFLLIFFNLRRPNASQWVKNLWPKVKIIVISMLLLDFLILFLGYYIWNLLELQRLLIHAGIVVTLFVNFFNNERITLNILEFPEEIEKK